MGEVLIPSAERFGDLFHEIPESEVFFLPCGGGVSSYCSINSLGFTYSVEVIPRQGVLDALTDRCENHAIAKTFRIVERAGTGRAFVEAEYHSMAERDFLADIDADSLPQP